MPFKYVLYGTILLKVVSAASTTSCGETEILISHFLREVLWEYPQFSAVNIVDILTGFYYVCHCLQGMKNVYRLPTFLNVDKYTSPVMTVGVSGPPMSVHMMFPR